MWQSIVFTSSLPLLAMDQFLHLLRLGLLLRFRWVLQVDTRLMLPLMFLTDSVSPVRLCINRLYTMGHRMWRKVSPQEVWTVKESGVAARIPQSKSEPQREPACKSPAFVASFLLYIFWCIVEGIKDLASSFKQRSKWKSGNACLILRSSAVLCRAFRIFSLQIFTFEGVYQLRTSHFWDNEQEWRICPDIGNIGSIGNKKPTKHPEPYWNCVARKFGMVVGQALMPEAEMTFEFLAMQLWSRASSRRGQFSRSLFGGCSLRTLKTSLNGCGECSEVFIIYFQKQKGKHLQLSSCNTVFKSF